MARQKGLYRKYHVEKVDGPTDPGAYYIVLRVDDGEYVDACRTGVLAFADAVRPLNGKLAADIYDLIQDFEEQTRDVWGGTNPFGEW